MAGKYPSSAKKLRAFYKRQALIRDPRTSPALVVAAQGYKTTGAVTRQLRISRKLSKHKQLKGLPTSGSRLKDWEPE